MPPPPHQQPGKCLHLLAAQLAVALGFTLAACVPAAPPHVLLISIDTLRRDHMGIYGYERNTTPEIDRFFSNGTIYESAWTSSPCTLPAVPQLLYGRFIPYARSANRPSSSRSLAELLRARGYTTAAVVSQHQFQPTWHPGGVSRDLAASVARGFDHFDVQSTAELDHHRMTLRTAPQVTDRRPSWSRSLLARWSGRPLLFA